MSEFPSGIFIVIHAIALMDSRGGSSKIFIAKIGRALIQAPDLADTLFGPPSSQQEGWSGS